MPWTASSVMEERLRFVARLLRNTAISGPEMGFEGAARLLTASFDPDQRTQPAHAV